jgi:hypothetical protein
MSRQIRTILALVAAALTLAGCAGGSTTNIDVHDSSIVIPTARIAVDFGERPGPPSQIHTSHAVELAVSGANGNDSFDIAAGQPPVVFGGTFFAAPQEVRAEFDFRFTEIAYRYRNVSERRGIGFEVLAGLAYAQLGLRLIGVTQTAAERLEGGGIVVSLGTMFRLWPSGSIQFRGSGFASTTSEGVSTVGRYELHFEQALGRHAAVRIGYAGWDVRSKREDDEYSGSNRSPIRVRINGPTVGVALMF